MILPSACSAVCVHCPGVISVTARSCSRDSSASEKGEGVGTTSKPSLGVGSVSKRSEGSGKAGLPSLGTGVSGSVGA